MSNSIKVIYDNENSPFLKMTEIWFRNKNLKYEKIDIANLEENFKNKINNINNKYPKIIINDNIIEGYSELIKKESYVLFLLGIYEGD